MFRGGRILEPPLGFSVTTLAYLKFGAVPPYSDFLGAVLQYHRIHPLHLIPNSIAHISLFAYLFEQFLGVPPCLELFRAFYSCRFKGKKKMEEEEDDEEGYDDDDEEEEERKRKRRGKGKNSSGEFGCCHFRLRDGLRKDYIHVSLRSKFKDWRRQWLYFGDDSGLEYSLPAAPPRDLGTWKEEAPDSADVRNLKAHILTLKQ
jgi:hypothetical protein